MEGFENFLNSLVLHQGTLYSKDLIPNFALTVAEIMS